MILAGGKIIASRRHRLCPHYALPSASATWGAARGSTLRHSVIVRDEWLATRSTGDSRAECGAAGDRTPDLGLAKPALSQLSYSPTKAIKWKVIKEDQPKPQRAKAGGPG